MTNNTIEPMVEEPTKGRFLWKLIRPCESGKKPLVIDFAMGPLPSRDAAVAAGNASLQWNRVGGQEAKCTWGGRFEETVPADL